MAGLWRAYLRALERAPITAKSVTAATLMMAGDAVAQKCIEQHEGYNVGRTLRLGTFGLCLAGPGMHYWYGAVQRMVPAAGMAGAVQRMLLDQVLFAPVIIGTFFVSQGALEGKSSQQIAAKLVADYPSTLKANYYLWPAAQLVNFALVPAPLRVLYVSGVSLVWNTFISVVNAREIHEVPIAEETE